MEIGDARNGAFTNPKAFLIRLASGSSFSSSPQLQRNAPSRTWWKHDGALNRWFTLPIAEMAWLVSLLNTLFSFARSSRKQILFEPILIRSISFVSVFVRVFLPVRWASASASEVASTSFLDARSTSMACFVSSRTLVRLSQVARCSQAAAAAVVAAAVFASCSSTWPWVPIKTTGFFFRVLSEWIQGCTEGWLSCPVVLLSSRN